jgi:hypothetical protein
MRRIAVVMVFVASVGGGWLAAQDKPKPVPDVPAQAPVLTEVQSLKLQNLTLQLQMAQTQIALLQTAAKQTAADRDALLTSIEKEHPGWALNRETGQWEQKPVLKPEKR